MSDATAVSQSWLFKSDCFLLLAFCVLLLMPPENPGAEAVDLQGAQLAELLASDPLNVLASIELMFRVMCGHPAGAAELSAALTRRYTYTDFDCLTHCLSLLARHEGLLAEAVVRSGKDSAHLLRRLTSLLVTGTKAALFVMRNSVLTISLKPYFYHKLAEA